MRLVLPAQIASITLCQLSVVGDDKQVQPAVVEQRPHLRMLFEDRRDRFDGGFKADR